MQPAVIVDLKQQTNNDAKRFFAWWLETPPIARIDKYMNTTGAVWSVLNDL
jgi:hypothetical protein